MKLHVLALCLIGFIAQAQQPLIRKDKITIARDSYGVPHIFAPTDPEVAYGLAYSLNG
jgi:acyl-homoserine-lactone acylase